MGAYPGHYGSTSKGVFVAHTRYPGKALSVFCRGEELVVFSSLLVERVTQRTRENFGFILCDSGMHIDVLCSVYKAHHLEKLALGFSGGCRGPLTRGTRAAWNNLRGTCILGPLSISAM